MFSIVTTQKILEKLYPEDSVWGNIVAQTKCFYVKLDTDWWEEDDMTPLMQLSNAQADIKDGKDIFSELDKHPEIIAKYPSSVFILDIEPIEAIRLQQRFGVIVQSFKNLDDAILTTVSKSAFDTESGEQGIGWIDVFRGVRDLPANALIINDRNLFTNDQVKTDRYGNVENCFSGVDNVKEILNTVLPRTLDVPFHVLIVCDKAGIDKHLNVKKVITLLNGIKKQVVRPYNIVIELLAVTSDSSFYPKTHNRRILTNYAVLTFDHKINAFEGRVSKSEQLITVNKLFSHSNLKEPSPYLKDHSRLVGALREYEEYVKQHPALAEHEFAKSGIASLKFDKTENRMII